jgi:hypothetical protein
VNEHQNSVFQECRSILARRLADRDQYEVVDALGHWVLLASDPKVDPKPDAIAELKKTVESQGRDLNSHNSTIQGLLERVLKLEDKPTSWPADLAELRDTVKYQGRCIDAKIMQGNVFSYGLAALTERVGRLEAKPKPEPWPATTPNELAAELSRIRVGDYLREWSYKTYVLTTTAIDTHAHVLNAIEAVTKDRFKNSVVRYGPGGTTIIAGNHKS